MPKLNNTHLYSQRNMLQQEQVSRRSSSISSSCSSGSDDSSSSSGALTLDETLALTPRCYQEPKPRLLRSKRSPFNLAALDANDEGNARYKRVTKSVITAPSQESFLKSNVQGIDREWGHFVDVAPWMEDPMTGRTF
jgi:hypothetical protein